MVLKQAHDVMQPIDMADFTYDLPDERVALFPVERRDHSKLLVYKAGEINHKQFYEIGEELDAETVLVFNDTKVIAARLFFKTESGALVEVLLLNPVNEELTVALQNTERCIWQAMIGNKRKLKSNTKLSTIHEAHGKNVTLEVSWVNHEDNHVALNWSGGLTMAEVLDFFGSMPLPPYLHREAIEADKDTYQTVYANKLGAVAAPTAGLHFTPELLEELKAAGIQESFVTLHVGAGTFLPVKVSNPVEHPMHAEHLIVTRELIRDLANTKKKIIVVGTTSLRTLESVYWIAEEVVRTGGFSGKIPQNRPYEMQTALLPDKATALNALADYLESQNQDLLQADTAVMIMPGYKWKVIDGLVTNFHQPGSTLLLLIAALIGEDWKDVYQQALVSGYRFLSYGDSSLLMRN